MFGLSTVDLFNHILDFLLGLVPLSNDLFLAAYMLQMHDKVGHFIAAFRLFGGLKGSVWWPKITVGLSKLKWRHLLHLQVPVDIRENKGTDLAKELISRGSILGCAVIKGSIGDSRDNELESLPEVARQAQI